MRKKTKLTPIQKKRITILKDALAQVQLGIYNVEASTGYVDRMGHLDLDGKIKAVAEAAELFTGKSAKDIELRSFIDNLISKKKPCQVCAKGAIFLSSIRKFNNYSLQDAVNCDLDSAASDEVIKLFGKENADL